MKKLTFSIEINTSRDKVWETLWDYAAFEEWSKFMDLSPRLEVDPDWKEGSMVYFWSDIWEGEYLMIKKIIPGELLLLSGEGVIIDGEAVPYEEDNEMKGAEEIYRLEEKDGSTELTVELPVPDEGYDEFYNEHFPVSLKKLKELAENRSKRQEAGSI